VNHFGACFGCARGNETSRPTAIVRCATGPRIRIASERARGIFPIVSETGSWTQGGGGVGAKRTESAARIAATDVLFYHVYQSIIKMESFGTYRAANGRRSRRPRADDARARFEIVFALAGRNTRGQCRAGVANRVAAVPRRPATARAPLMRVRRSARPASGSRARRRRRVPNGSEGGAKWLTRANRGGRFANTESLTNDSFSKKRIGRARRRTSRRAIGTRPMSIGIRPIGEAPAGKRDRSRGRSGAVSLFHGLTLRQAPGEAKIGPSC
jgi:hypothetical protein